MSFAMVLVILILLSSLIGTLVLTGKKDDNYKTSAKQNTLRLTAIYLFLIICSLAGLAWYINSN
ncbi:hypothetical protein RCG23_15515 [Neobacillus sp. PS3-34]|uniref:hypothetical protein n=1 Tax=Neobacillus sp. PS3-34 TaxID=3070678 RepID=UPI0027DF4426|nr:hypothetical protein [Neobacillus sp. PS3-34]WML47006.1 hypothetical protein RCG23_15515 [Neobacillus sp. PS3-34]